VVQWEGYSEAWVACSEPRHESHWMCMERSEISFERGMFFFQGRTLEEAQKGWNSMESKYIKELYESMPRRISALVDAEGRHTKY